MSSSNNNMHNEFDRLIDRYIDLCTVLPKRVVAGAASAKEALAAVDEVISKIRKVGKKIGVPVTQKYLNDKYNSAKQLNKNKVG